MRTNIDFLMLGGFSSTSVRKPYDKSQDEFQRQERSIDNGGGQALRSHGRQCVPGVCSGRLIPRVDTGCASSRERGAALAIAAVLVPSHRGPVQRVWMTFVHAICRVTTPLVMAVPYLGDHHASRIASLYGLQ